MDTTTKLYIVGCSLVVWGITLGTASVPFGIFIAGIFILLYGFFYWLFINSRA